MMSSITSKYERFNPRPHAEGDGSLNDFVVSVKVSIHALTRRAT